MGAMLEGEGCFLLRYPDDKHPTALRGGLRCASTDIETIATLLRLVGDGNVGFHRPAPAHYKDVWWWDLAKQRSLLALLPQIMPFLTSKYLVAQEMYEKLRGYVDHYGEGKDETA